MANKDRKVIFRPWITNPKTGKKIFASTYGKKAFPIFIDSDDKRGS
jgi:hypothetical protein